MIINVHAGHNPKGKVACGAVGLVDESEQNRIVKDKVIALLKADGHTVYDCTCEDGTSQSNVLTKIVAKCNAHKADIDVSIHFNAGANDKSGNGVTTGTEVFVYSSTSAAKDEATRICKNIAALGFKNRGVKVSSSLYVLRKTNAPALLVECCFVDDADDIKKYNATKMAEAIASGIVGKTLKTATTATTTTTTSGVKSVPFTVKVIDDSLNVRKGPGTSYEARTPITNHGTYTIVKVSGNWGLLKAYEKTGDGWISISTKYVKYV